ncbi:BolA-like protein 3 [Tyrophagus putrescentiae]|nr:BolA-like protein 3 [Tyrophagus putrescentiae]
MLTSRLTFLKAFSSTTSSSLQRVLFGGNRYVSQANGNSGNIGGEIIKQALKRNFPNAADIVVQDISGGCGAMFEVYVVSDEFKGVARVKQHLAVSNALKNEIKDMHGIRIFTDVPPVQDANANSK